MTTVWTICGANRGVGKTHLALRLCDVLPDAVYIKRGHGAHKDGKPSNYVMKDAELDRFLAEEAPRHRHAIVESNAYALRAQGDIIIYLESPAGESNRRTDCLAMRAMAEVVVEPGARKEQWRTRLWGFLGEGPLLESVLEVLQEQADYWAEPRPVVRSKIWLQVRAGRVLGPGLFRLLDGIARYGSLQASAKAAGVHYAWAWRQIREAEQRLGQALVVRRRGGAGGGSSDLTAEGRHLREVFDRVNREVEAFADARFEEHYGHRED